MKVDVIPLKEIIYVKTRILTTLAYIGIISSTVYTVIAERTFVNIIKKKS